MQKAIPVTLKDALAICQTIEGLLQRSLGPNGLHTMLTSPTGNVVITGDGYTLLTSLHLSHPIARWIVGQIKGHHGVTGDNSKSLILIVTEILRQLQKAVTPRDSAAEECSAKQDLIQINYALETILSETFPGIVRTNLLKSCICVNLVEGERERVLSICSKMVKTALSGKFNKRSTEHVASLTVDLVCGSSDDIGCLRNDLDRLIVDYDVTCIEVTNQPVVKSILIDGVVLTRSFSFQSEDLDSLTKVPFVIFNCSLDKWIPEVQSTLLTRNSDAMAEIFQYGMVHTRTLIDFLKRSNVRLVLSSEALSDVSVSHCRAADISVVHMIPEGELKRLAQLTKTDIIYDTTSIAAQTLEPGFASFCRRFLLGQHVGVHLGISENAAAKQLVLCAPTQGICRQWFIAVYNTLKTLRMWLDTSWLTDIEEGKVEVNTSVNEEAPPKLTNSCESYQNQDGVDSTLCDFSTGDDTPCVDQLNHLHLESSNSSATETNSFKPKQENRQRARTNKQENEQTVRTNNQVALCLPGGGCAEFLLYKLFQNLRKNNSTEYDSLYVVKNPSMKTALHILSESALCIPRTLFKNSFSRGSHGSSFIQMVSSLKDAESLGIHGKSGRLCDLAECGVLETLLGRLMLWNDAVQTVVELLRIDTIIGIKTIKAHQGNGSDDSDSGDDV
ncbi:BBSome complex assembly protein BBS10-like [Asterias amurensis]|uniref:BBSome complex assembly protein BBS10-like n=1 Tax=Asterias amurensis TaxID=7602 RepID=UPI003AB26262